jgi:hypothetical protein
MKLAGIPKPLLARVTGLEPATSGVTGRRSNQLSYTRSGRRQRLGRVAEGVKGLRHDRCALGRQLMDADTAAARHRV